jgi:uncharacterized membrane protein YecN with MAPEG domain
MNVTPVYTAILALIFVALSLRTIRMRRKLRIAIGDDGNETMKRAMRVHSNFAEYVPIALLLMFFAESTGTKPAMIHLLGLALVAGRCLHAYGVSQPREKYGFRIAGMTLTFLAIVAPSINLLASSLSR